MYKIVEIEGPVHEEELVARVRDLWGKERAGPQIQDAVARATRSLLIGKRCSREDSCLRLPRAVVLIRDRGAGRDSGRDSGGDRTVTGIQDHRCGAA